MKLLILLICLGSQLYAQKPNIVLIMTDDQGYGDLGFHKNPNIKTPYLDDFASQSIRFTDFYVSPVCAPTRASLMTGRYSLRTGVRDTYNGGAIMAPNEITLAELLQGQGYKTGIFGKWHLGDNYPSRPQDQGYDESLIHHSGGMGQVGDLNTYFQKDSSYFNPKLWKNGKTEQFKGYCTDIFTDGALNFIDKNASTPFLAYVAFNAPHTPLQVPQKYLDIYKHTDPRKGLETLSPEMSQKDIENAKKVFAMITNIDENVNRILTKLDELSIAENTIVIFMTDNGPQQIRYVGGMKGRKGSVYRGGVRVPFFFRYPAKFKGNRDVSSTAAHIDVLPTLADLCGFEIPKDRTIDGISMVPSFNGQNNKIERSLFFTWTRRTPVLYQNMALQKGDYRLVANTDFNSPLSSFELYNYRNDKGEKHNLIEKEIVKAKELKAELDQIYQELIQSPQIIEPQVSIIGDDAQKVVVLNRNDAAGERGIWAQSEIQGYWNVEVKEGSYQITFTFLEPITTEGNMMLQMGSRVWRQKIKTSKNNKITFDRIALPDFKGALEPKFIIGKKELFPFYVTVTSLP